MKADLDYNPLLPYGDAIMEQTEARLEDLRRRLPLLIQSQSPEGIQHCLSQLNSISNNRFPIPFADRVLFCKLFYTLIVTPGMDPTLVGKLCDAMSTLISGRADVTSNDLQLEWRPLYDVLKKYRFSKNRTAMSEVTTSRSLVSLVSRVRCFFSQQTISELMDELLPSISMGAQQMCESLYLLVIFMPTHHVVHFDADKLDIEAAAATGGEAGVMRNIKSILPTLFSIWQTYCGRNASFVDRFLLTLMRNIAQNQHGHLYWIVPDSRDVDGCYKPNSKPLSSKEVGISLPIGATTKPMFTDEQIRFVISRTMAMMDLPDAASEYRSNAGGSGSGSGGAWSNRVLAQAFSSATTSHGASAMDDSRWSVTSKNTTMLGRMSNLKDTPLDTANFASFLVWTMLSPEYLSKNGNQNLPDVMAYVESIFQNISSLLHPSNFGEWTRTLCNWMYLLTESFSRRLLQESNPIDNQLVPDDMRITNTLKRRFVKAVRDPAFLLIFSKNSSVVSYATAILKMLAWFEPRMIIPQALNIIYPALDNVTEAHRTTSALKLLRDIVPILTHRSHYPEGGRHIYPLLRLLLPAIDINDASKTQLASNILLTILTAGVQFADVSNSTINTELRSQSSVDSGGIDGYGCCAIPETENGDVIFEDNDDENGFYAVLGYGGYSVPYDATSEVPNPRLSQRQHVNRVEEDAYLRSQTAGAPQLLYDYCRRILDYFRTSVASSSLEPNVEIAGEANTRTYDYTTLEGLANSISSLIGTIPRDDMETNANTQKLLDMIMDFVRTVRCGEKSMWFVTYIVSALVSHWPKTMTKLYFDLCNTRIRAEIASGAGMSSTHYEHSVLPAGDVELCWFVNILSGIMYGCGSRVTATGDGDQNLCCTTRKSAEDPGPEYGYSAVLDIKDELVDLLDLLVNTSRERNVRYGIRSTLQGLLRSLIYFSAKDISLTPQQLHNEHHLLWGQQISQSRDTKMIWRIPDKHDVDFAVEILNRYTASCITALESIMNPNRTSALARAVSGPELARWISLMSMLTEHAGFMIPGDIDCEDSDLVDVVETPTGDDGLPLPVHDKDQFGDWNEPSGNYPHAFKTRGPRFLFKLGYTLSDTSDSRWKSIARLRARVGVAMLRLIQWFRLYREDDVANINNLLKGTEKHILKRTTDLVSASTRTKEYGERMGRFSPADSLKRAPRSVIIDRINLQDIFLAVANDDNLPYVPKLHSKLAEEIALLSLNAYETVSKYAANTLDSVLRLFPRLAGPLVPRLIEAMNVKRDKPNPERMTGALIAMSGSAVRSRMLRSTLNLKRLVRLLFMSQFEDKPEVQTRIAAAVVYLQHGDNVSLGLRGPAVASPNALDLAQQVFSRCGLTSEQLVNGYTAEQLEKLWFNDESYDKQVADAAVTLEDRVKSTRDKAAFIYGWRRMAFDSIIVDLLDLFDQSAFAGATTSSPSLNTIPTSPPPPPPSLSQSSALTLPTPLNSKYTLLVATGIVDLMWMFAPTHQMHKVPAEVSSFFTSPPPPMSSILARTARMFGRLMLSDLDALRTKGLTGSTRMVTLIKNSSLTNGIWTGQPWLTKPLSASTQSVQLPYTDVANVSDKYYFDVDGAGWLVNPVTIKGYPILPDSTPNSAASFPSTPEGLASVAPIWRSAAVELFNLFTLPRFWHKFVEFMAQEGGRGSRRRANKSTDPGAESESLDATLILLYKSAMMLCGPEVMVFVREIVDKLFASALPPLTASASHAAATTLITPSVSAATSAAIAAAVADAAATSGKAQLADDSDSSPSVELESMQIETNDTPKLAASTVRGHIAVTAAATLAGARVVQSPAPPAVSSFVAPVVPPSVGPSITISPEPFTGNTADERTPGAAAAVAAASTVVAHAVPASLIVMAKQPRQASGTTFDTPMHALLNSRQSGVLLGRERMAKQRAIMEFIVGIIQGTKHWHPQDTKAAWSWMQPILRSFMQSITPESQSLWGVFVAHISMKFDYRRFAPIIEILTSRAFDISLASDASFAESVKMYLQMHCVRNRWHITSKVFVPSHGHEQMERPVTSSDGVADPRCLIGVLLRNATGGIDRHASLSADSKSGNVDFVAHHYQVLRDMAGQVLNELTQIRPRKTYASAKEMIDRNLANNADGFGELWVLDSVLPLAGVGFLRGNAVSASGDAIECTGQAVESMRISTCGEGGEKDWIKSTLEALMARIGPFQLYKQSSSPSLQASSNDVMERDPVKRTHLIKTALVVMRRSLADYRHNVALANLDLMLPTLFHAFEDNTDKDLLMMSDAIRVMISSLILPSKHAEMVATHILDVLTASPNTATSPAAQQQQQQQQQKSSSALPPSSSATGTPWIVKAKTMPLLQSFYFNHLLLLSDATKQKFVDALVKMLSDEQVDLRQIAAVTLTDIIKCSPASLLTDLLDKFIVRCKKRLPKAPRKPTTPTATAATAAAKPSTPAATATSTSGKEVTPEFYALAIRRRHSAVLGLASLVMAHPYDIPDWMPEALMLIAGAHADPSPIDVTVKRVFAEFKRTHSDRWHEDKYKFTSDQRDMLTDMLVSPSYYA